MDDENLEKIKEEKLKKLKSQMEQEGDEEKRREQLEQQKKQLLRQILTSDARSRLSNLRMAKPDFTENIELQLIQIARSGRIDLPITDEKLRKILKKLQQDKKSINIKRK
ncbi:hypothetical protein AKJ51_02495 [candidate division MSBL1 archaeon SCGC-AAA382A20]|uniref:DNA-binding protein AKJ51_02495 n=1 Tax=candidate division MSBL1 archaeon SCGC-AAA382A20 TaxID=1698280 RepID=A0A133VKD7_9EURY|nr:hypothetical protein AKJ51_02495 [candidate division MSBL1 archaeon SCGC-AAA382A20]